MIHVLPLIVLTDHLDSAKRIPYMHTRRASMLVKMKNNIAVPCVVVFTRLCSY